jgi:hypothetical protein
VLFCRRLTPIRGRGESDVLNGVAEKQPADYPSALARRLSLIEARPAVLVMARERVEVSFPLRL